MKYTVAIDYLGGILSENSYKFATRGTKPFVRLWMRQLAKKVKELEVPEADEYDVFVHGNFTDERRPDIQNLFKVVSDAVAKGLGVNDKHLCLLDDGYDLGFVDPSLFITIIPKDARVRVGELVAA